MSNKSDKSKNEQIGLMLQRARESKRLSQSDMEFSTGLTKGHISTLERGVSKASIETLLGYCKTLDMTPNQILGYTDDVIPEILSELSDMSVERQYKILDIIKSIKSL